MMRAIDRFFDEIRTHKKFVAAVEREPKWRNELDGLEHVLDRMFRSDIAAVIAACDRIVAVVDDRSLPLKQRLLSVQDAMSEVVRKDG